MGFTGAPAHARLTRVVQGAFGDLVSIRCQRNRSRHSFAAIADQVHTVFRTLIHDIDLLLWLSASRLVAVTALERRQGVHRTWPRRDVLRCWSWPTVAAEAAVAHRRLSDAAQGLRIAEAMITSARQRITLNLN